MRMFKGLFTLVLVAPLAACGGMGMGMAGQFPTIQYEQTGPGQFNPVSNHVSLQSRARPDQYRCLRNGQPSVVGEGWCLVPTSSKSIASGQQSSYELAVSQQHAFGQEETDMATAVQRPPSGNRIPVSFGASETPWSKARLSLANGEHYPCDPANGAYVLGSQLSCTAHIIHHAQHAEHAVDNSEQKTTEHRREVKVVERKAPSCTSCGGGGSGVPNVNVYVSPHIHMENNAAMNAAPTAPPPGWYFVAPPAPAKTKTLPAPLPQSQVEQPKGSSYHTHEKKDSSQQADL